MFDARPAGLIQRFGAYGGMVALVVFWLGALRNAELPGLYMDAINPDYMFARWLNPELKNTIWAMPGRPLPLLGNLYHGVQTLYVGVLTYGLLGTSVVSVRVTHALYGSLIILLAWLILRRVTGRPVLAMVLAIVLAADMAFLGSFRTQAYIILAGQVWMMLALWAAIRCVMDDAPPRWLLLLSGVGMGLATYGYFVFLFFLPPMAVLAVFGPGFQGARQRLLVWTIGFVIGMMPYVLGYIELAVAVGGVGALVEWMRNALGALKPTVASQTYGVGLEHVLTFAQWGLADLGNEHTMIGEAVSLPLLGWRSACVGLSVVVCLLGAGLEWKARPQLARTLLACVAMPASFIAIAAGFGSRLGVHHFTTLVVLGYLLLGLSAYWLALCLPKGRWPGIVGWVLALALLTVNIVQQNKVHERLIATGGTGMSTDALTVMARTALTEQRRAIWFFPEWGFFMPFAFLTANQVPYELSATVEVLELHRAPDREIRIAFWQEESQQQYRKILEQAGIQDIQLQPLHRRDGEPALYLLKGRYATSLAVPQ